MDYAPWEGKQMGAYGEDAGAAYVFSRSAAADGYIWRQDQVGATTASSSHDDGELEVALNNHACQDFPIYMAC